VTSHEGGRMTRDTRRAWIAGVCAGIARELSCPVAVVRALAVGSLIVGVLPAVVVYVLLWIAFPEDK